MEKGHYILQMGELLTPGHLRKGCHMEKDGYRFPMEQKITCNLIRELAVYFLKNNDYLFMLINVINFKIIGSLQFSDFKMSGHSMKDRVVEYFILSSLLFSGSAKHIFFLYYYSHSHNTE